MNFLEVRLRHGSAPAGPRLRVRGPADVWEACPDLRDADREVCQVLHLDAGNVLRATETVAVGTLTRTLLSCREIFKGALLHNSAAIVLVHNHPSGDPTPSEEDLAISDRVAEAGKLLGVPLLDHVVVSRDGYRSALRTSTR